MKHLVKSIPALLAAVFLLCALPFPATPQPAPQPSPQSAPQSARRQASAAQADLTSRLDRVFSEAYPADEPGAAILVQHRGETILRQGYGLADLEDGTPIAPDMVFRLGSLTKQFTATGILLLEQEGKLSLQDDITRILPDFPTGDHEITIEHLLTHTSGIFSYTDDQEVMQTVARDWTQDEVVAVFKDKELKFEPGSDWSYSNSGYFLLGMIIEAVTGTSYADFIRTRICEPLGLSDTRYGDLDENNPRRTAGYQKEPEGYIDAPAISMTLPFAAGALVSTVDDLVLWNEALLANRVLPREVRERMWTPYPHSEDKQTGYAYGWMIGSYEGQRIVHHGGGIHGFSSFALCLPEEELFVAILSNNPHGRHEPQHLAQKATSLVMGDPLDWEPITLSSLMMARFAGVYEINENEERIVTVKNGTLFTQRTGGSKNRAFAHSDRGFFYKHTLSHFWFEFDEMNRVNQMVMKPWGGKEEIARRTDRPIPDDRVVATIDPDIFDAYIGKYEILPTLAVTITREAHRLLLQPTGQDKIELLPSSDTVFYLDGGAEGRVVFIPDEATGEVNSLLLQQGNLEMEAKRVEP